MSEERRADVLVVGAGPVGLLSALTVAERGATVRVIDKELSTAARSYALALHPRTLELLDDAGIAEPLVEAGWRVDRVGIYEDERVRGNLELSRLDSRFPFVLVVPQSRLEELLERRLEGAGVEIEWGHRLSALEIADGMADALVERLERVSTGYAAARPEHEVADSGHTVARFVIGADGHGSAVRKALGIGFDAKRDAELFAVVEFEAGASPGHEMRVVFHDGLLSALWPLSRTRCRWSFQLESADSPGSREKQRLAVEFGDQSYAMLDDRHLAELAAQRAPWFRPLASSVRWSAGVQFERRLARAFGRGNVWLAGDAAHLAGPVGVQSMNLGLQEGREIASRMARVLHDDAPGSILEEYGEERRTDWHLLMSGEEALVATDQADGWTARHRGLILECMPASGSDLKSLAEQIGLDVF